ncbi:tetratricopeptide repeat-containing protein [Okeania sp. SIO2B3]|uniref:tetratricopeptide repeat-containing protein n=1 Tax=Okeania sp. SIO2B3 TaxID=2607784 RepID=UPI0034296242
MALLYRDQGRYTEAEPLYKNSLAIREKVLGVDHPSVAESLNNLADIYSHQGRYSEAEPLLQRSLAIDEKALGAENPSIAISLNNLGTFYHKQGRYSEAEPLYQRSLAILEKAWGADHPSVATSLNNLAEINYDQRRHSEAESFYQRSLAITEKALGADHPAVATTLNNLGVFYCGQEKYSEAKLLLQRALAIREKALGADHPDVATSLHSLALFYQAQGNTTDAIDFHHRGMEVEETTLTTFLATGSESQKQASAIALSNSTNRTISLHLQNAPTNPEAVSLALTTILRRKARILDSITDSLQIIRDNLTPENKKLLSDLAATRAQLAALIYNRPAKADYCQVPPRFLGKIVELYKRSNKPKNLPLEQYRQQVANLKGKAEKLEADLSRASAAFGKTSQPVTIEIVQQLIPPDAALLEIMQYKPDNAKAKSSERFGQPHYAAYILHSTGAPQWLDLGVAEPIHKAVAEFRYRLSRPGTPPPKNSPHLRPTSDATYPPKTRQHQTHPPLPRLPTQLDSFCHPRR